MNAMGLMVRHGAGCVNEKCHEFITQGKKLAVVTDSFL
jgi:hypothetical protein